MQRLKKRSSRRPALPEIMLTPMIDTFCVLLIIFIIAAPMAHNDIKVELPQGKTKEVAGAQEFVVSINKENKIFFNSYPIQRSELISSVQREIASKEEIPIYVRADKAIPYGKVIEIVDELKRAGIHYVALSTQPF